MRKNTKEVWGFFKGGVIRVMRVKRIIAVVMAAAMSLSTLSSVGVINTTQKVRAASGQIFFRRH